MALLLQERSALVSVRTGCEALALPRASLYRYQARQRGQAEAQSRTAPRASARPTAENALAARERAEVLETLNSVRFADQPPAEVYATLLSEGTYLCSVSTLYRPPAGRETNG